ncbi:MAG: sigma-70 family RNA polymerase sigma factor [Betaproteobacteria bacterium]|nr:sigma-70 family RNA polymerase sigma factor [Betaproteobacteria bacterium]
MSETPEFRVKVTVRNNLLLTAIEDAGYAGWGGLARFVRDNADIGQSQLSAMLSMRDAPITSEGEFSVTAKALMQALGASPSDLWTDEQLTMRLPKNTSEARMSAAGVRALLEAHTEQMTLPSPEEAVDESMSRAMVSRVLGSLRTQEEKVLRMRFGIDTDERTLEECAKVMGVTRERVRQIESKAIRKLKHPSRTDVLMGMGAVRAEAAERKRAEKHKRWLRGDK